MFQGVHLASGRWAMNDGKMVFVQATSLFALDICAQHVTVNSMPRYDSIRELSMTALPIPCYPSILLETKPN
jgi:hypothetical protein